MFGAPSRKARSEGALPRYRLLRGRATRRGLTGLPNASSTRSSMEPGTFDEGVLRAARVRNEGGSTCHVRLARSVLVRRWLMRGIRGHRGQRFAFAESVWTVLEPLRNAFPRRQSADAPPQQPKRYAKVERIAPLTLEFNSIFHITSIVGTRAAIRTRTSNSPTCFRRTRVVFTRISEA